MKDQNCVFCKIIEGTIPSYKIYEDEFTLAFLSIDPINEGHTLVIPKNHTDKFYDIDEMEYIQVFKTVREVAKNIDAKLNPKRVGIIVAGWDVPHTHIHVVPMNEYHDITSQKLLDKTTLRPTKEEFEKTLKKIKM